MATFDRFLGQYRTPCDSVKSAENPRQPWGLGPVMGFEELMGRYSGCTFNEGIYRLHTQASGEKADAWVRSVLPAIAGRVYCFGYDWLGRQFALDAERRISGSAPVLLCDLAEGSWYHVDQSFNDFHNVELVEYDDAALDISMFKEWASANAKFLPLGPEQCVGYRIPLVLGGKHEVGNLELSDLEVEVGMLVQIHGQIEGLPEGTDIAGADIRDEFE